MELILDKSMLEVTEGRCIFVSESEVREGDVSGLMLFDCFSTGCLSQ